MSVYIRGMEMPNNCRDCPLEDAYEGYNCRIVEKSANWGLEGRPSWCPLIPAPPHGDLIDRDALLDTATIHWSQTTNESCFPIDEIEYAPTVIPADEMI